LDRSCDHLIMELDDKIWLVKSTNRILGPISKSEMIKKIKTREIHLNDDACSPGRRWQSVQSHPDLADIIEEIRRLVVSEETEVSWTPGNSTQTLTDLSDSDLTEELSDKISQMTRTQEIVIHDLPEEKKPMNISGARYQATSLGQSLAAKKRTENTTKWLWITTVAILVAALIFVVQRKNANQADLRPALSLESLQTIVPELVQDGDYVEALKDLKEYYHDPLQSGTLGIYMGPLLIQVDGQTVVGRRLLNQVLGSGKGDAKLAYTGIGVADLIEGSLASAQENFQRALSLDRQYVPALIDMGAAQFKKGDFEKAREFVMSAIHINPGEGEAQLILAENAIQMNQSAPKPNALSEAINELTKYRSQQMDYEVEAGFYSIYLDWLKQGKKIADEKVLGFLDTDPELTENHRHNVFIYKGINRWPMMARLCEQLADSMGEVSRSATLRAVCYSKEGRKAEARMWIEKAVQQAPQDSIAQAWYSQILSENGMGDQASVALGRANELNRKGDHQLPIIMQARFCEQAGDVDCAKQNWTRLLERNVRSITALGGLAKVYAKQNAFSEAANYIERGLTVSPSYIPLLKLRSKAKAAGWYGHG
jgi:tetratricopeptide (TPR) repeat protein